MISIALGAVPVKETNVAKAVDAPTKNKIMPDDNAALNDWKWLPQYNLNSAFTDYIQPILEK